MSLTDDWKAGKLKEGNYYCKITVSPEIEMVYSGAMYDDLIVEILAEVPSYGNFVELTEKVKKQEKEIAKGDGIIGKLLKEGSSFRTKNNKLRGLLKECKEYLSDVDTYFTKNADEAVLLLTKINEVINDN